MKLTEYETNMIQNIEKNIHEGILNNNFLVQIFELSRDYLNLQSLSDYAKEHDISYNGAKKRKLEKVNIGKNIFIIDNN